MRLALLPSLWLLCLTAVNCNPLFYSHSSQTENKCSAQSLLIRSAEDLKAKIRSEHGVCPAAEVKLFSRQAGSVTDDYSCDASRPCKNGACCAKSGYCGYGKDSCGDGTTPNDKCWSNCGAHAECGRDALVPGTKCPLNVCCSQYGFCGMTEEFCKKDSDPLKSCQSHCDQPGSGGSKGDVQKRVMGYYEAWNWNKNCMGMRVKDIPVESITHLQYAFVYVAPGTYEITTMDNTVPVDLYTQITGLKTRNTELKVVASLGGWTFSDNGTVTQPLLSEIVSSAANRAKFIDNLLSFMRNYGFDGIDFDWEYPGAPDRGGKETDGVNFTILLKELRQRYSGIISFTTPTSYWYLRHFDLKASTEHVDWVNVMSYDLHGIWDSSNPIGNHVLAHTNITEIKLALDLYWRNGVPANKLNLGLGFYGRSFQLADPSCSKPGCLFKGGASKGECTDNSGTLSYREIMDIIDKHKLKPYYDKQSQVKYITWDSDQWVSYDDKDTFQAKIKFANDLGLGGLLIWSLDQDTTKLDALAGVLSPKPLNGFSSQAMEQDTWDPLGAGDCRTTECGVSNCKIGEVRMGNTPCDDDSRREQALCCPLASAPDPKTCSWRGNPDWCNGQCHVGEVALRSSRYGEKDTGYCYDGRKFYCCPADNAFEECRYTGCGGSCNSDENELTWRWAHCLFDPQKLCCKKTRTWENCAWYGKPGSCFDDHCPTGHSVALSVSYDGAGEDCGWRLERKRSFCCDPGKGRNPFSPVPLEYLFKEPPKGDGVDTKFTLKIDPTNGGAQNTGPTLADDPTAGEFGFVVMTSPETIQTSLDKRDGSHWDVFDCTDDKTEEAQTVRMVCLDSSEQSTCHKIHLGHGAVGTIVEMPAGCGPGKYAVVKDMQPSGDQQLPEHLKHKRDLHGSTIYDLTFDYDFTRVPRDLGNTQIRIDTSNEPGYWDKVVDKAASKRKKKRDLSEYQGNHRRWLEDAWREDIQEFGHDHPELHKRWFGSDVISWLKGLLNGGNDGLDVPLIKDRFTEDYTVRLVDQTFPDCPVGNNIYVSGKVKIQATTHVELDTDFGFTLITTLSSFSLSNSYLYFRNRGQVKAKFTAEALVKATWESGDITLLSADKFGVTFSVPGIVTVGPNFKLAGNVAASLEAAASFSAAVNIAEWDVRQTYPAENSDWEPKSKKTPNRDGTQELLKPEFKYGLSVSGSLEAHVMAIVTFGIDFNDKLSAASATANLVADGHMTFRAEATTADKSFCYGIDAGAELYATINAPSFPKWILPQDRFQLAQTPAIQIIPRTCQKFARDLSSADAFYLAQNESEYAVVDLARREVTTKPLFTIPFPSCPGQATTDNIGECLFCPPKTTQSKRDDGDVCILQEINSGESVCSRGLTKRSSLLSLTASWYDGSNGTATGHIEKRTPKTGKWDGFTIEMGNYKSCSEAASDGKTSKWWGFQAKNAPTTDCPLTITKFTAPNIETGDYQSDHVFEAQMILQFFNMLRGQGTIPLPNGYRAASNNWVEGRIMGFVGAALAAVPCDGAGSLLIAMSQGLGGNGAEGRMALLEKGVNNAKGTWLQLGTPDTSSGSRRLRAAKIHYRDAAGVFQYLRQQTIWDKFTEASRLMETSCAAFDRAYTWQYQPGAAPVGAVDEPIRPGRADAGIRDLWCYFLDASLLRVEGNAAAWATAAAASARADAKFAGTEGQKFNNGFWRNRIITDMRFLRPNPTTPNAQGVWQQSQFGVWGNAQAGPW